MRTPINVLLTGLSTAQFLLALNYLIFLAIEQLKILCYEFPWSYGVAVYRFFNVNLNIVFHTVAFAHTIVVAIFRYGAIRWPIAANRTLLQNKTAFYASLAVWHVVPIICIPVFLSSKVAKTEGLCQMKQMYDLNYSKNAALVAGIFWMFGIVLKLIPSLVLSVFLILLIKSLRRVERRRQIGFSAPNLKNNDVNSQSSLLTANSGRNARMIATQRTTRMLIAIMILCVSVSVYIYI
uniref:G-protein coupled receptors family 1 profile domain-containing protein n=1 Tax=Panagrolaimus sp. ES5 TaxID=591445 RepID=A0AC34FLZ4_9BILA